MTSETNSSLSAESDSGPARRRWSFKRGLLVGAVALLASIGGTAVLASAQSGEEPVAESDVEGSESEGSEFEDAYYNSDSDDYESGDYDFEFDNAAWEAYDTCVDDQLAAAGFDIDELFAQYAPNVDPDAVDELSDEEIEAIEEAIPAEAFDAIDEAFEAADLACEDHLPAELLELYEADEAAWAEYDVCVEELFAGVDAGEGEGEGSHVWVADEDSDKLVIFGDEQGSVTISGDSSSINVTGDGVEVLEGDALDTYFEKMDDLWSEAEACDAFMPEFVE